MRPAPTSTFIDERSRRRSSRGASARAPACRSTGSRAPTGTGTRPGASARTRASRRGGGRRPARRRDRAARAILSKRRNPRRTWTTASATAAVANQTFNWIVAREEQRVRLLGGGIVRLAVHAECDRDRAAGEEHRRRHERARRRRRDRPPSASLASYSDRDVLAPPGPPVTGGALPHRQHDRVAARPRVLVVVLGGTWLSSSGAPVTAPRRRWSFLDTARIVAGRRRARRAGNGFAHRRPSVPAAHGPGRFRRVRRRLRDLLPRRRALRRGVHRARRGLHHRSVLLRCRPASCPATTSGTRRWSPSATACSSARAAASSPTTRSRSATTCSPATTCTSPTPTTATKTRRCRSASSSRRRARCASGVARGWATAPSSCPAPTSAATSRSVRDPW